LPTQITTLARAWLLCQIRSAEHAHAVAFAAVQQRIVVQESEQPPGRADGVERRDGRGGLAGEPAGADDQQILDGDSRISTVDRVSHVRPPPRSHADDALLLTLRQRVEQRQDQRIAASCSVTGSGTCGSSA
jgi:hypothetical protein